MKIGALSFLERMHCNGKPSSSILIAALHWKWSLTWRWHFSWHPGLSGKIGPYFMRVHKHSPGFNFHAGLNLPVMGAFSIQTQPNMPLKKKESK
jgi:hypothetical protein